MNAEVKSWRRMLAVRRAQAKIAMGEASAAQAAESNLQENALRLRRLRDSAWQVQHCRDGQALHAQLEMGSRLIKADQDITVALGQARQAVAAAERQRTAAFIRRETADRLLDRAINRHEALQERKAEQLPLRRAAKTKGEKP